MVFRVLVSSAYIEKVMATSWGDRIMFILKYLVIWAGIGGLAAFLRLACNLHIFHDPMLGKYSSKGQIILLSIIYGPAWFVILPLWGVWFGLNHTIKKIEELWKLLSEIGPYEK